MPDFIIIDDDPINNLICSRIIEINYPNSAVTSYLNPVTALAEIEQKYTKPGANDVVVFLDINMPELSGWEVLEIFEGYPAEVQKLFKIFILSSSVDALDKLKAGKNPHVNDYIPKPLSKAILDKIL